MTFVISISSHAVEGFQRLNISFDLLEADKLKADDKEFLSDIKSLTKRRGSQRFRYLSGGEFTLPPYTQERFVIRQPDSDTELTLSWRPKKVLDRNYATLKYSARISFPMQKEFTQLEKETDVYPGSLPVLIRESDTPNGKKDTRPIWVLLRAENFEPPFAFEKLGGIGAKINIKDGFPCVTEVVDGSPALKAGFAPGDKILEVDGISMLQVTVDEASRFLRGDPGTDVRLKIRRSSAAQAEEISLKRAILDEQR